MAQWPQDFAILKIMEAIEIIATELRKKKKGQTSMHFLKCVNVSTSKGAEMSQGGQVMFTSQTPCHECD